MQSSPIAENGDIVVFGDIAENGDILSTVFGDIPPTLLFWGIPRGALEDQSATPEFDKRQYTSIETFHLVF